MLTSIATALAGLATAGVVHRDLKPENVLLLADAWCLADFGISRYAEASTSPDTRKYSMTSAYAAPEQWRLMRATAATDIYAFGVIAHELLVGHRPFPGPGQDDFRDQHLTRAVPLLENVGAPLSALVGECLYKEPAARPPAANLVARLAGITAAPATAGLAQLQQANRQEVARLGAEASRRTQAELDAERRQGLAAAARSSFKMIGDELQEAIRGAAPAATLQASSSGWSLHLSGAQLKFTEPRVTQGGELHAYGTSLGIEVIACASMSVTMTEPNYYGYRGRSHSLWFCNARDPEHYQWFELAFMHSPLMRLPSHPDVNPFSRGPDKTAAETLSTTMTEQQLAWPFTPIGPGQLDDFIGRWGSWLAAAAGRQLQHPTTMPEQPTDGSYRKV